MGITYVRAARNSKTHIQDSTRPKFTVCGQVWSLELSTPTKTFCKRCRKWEINRTLKLSTDNSQLRADLSKRCSRCKETKPLSEFGFSINNVCGYTSACRDCTMDTQRKSRQKTSLLNKTRPVPVTKQCSRCEEIKPSPEFWRDSQSADGLLLYCKSCRKDMDALRLKPVPDVLKCRVCKKFYPPECFHRSLGHRYGRGSICKECHRVKSQEYSKRNILKTRDYTLRVNFGIGVEEYNTLLARQKGVCVICGQPESAVSYSNGKVKALAVDHDHLTGKVRGLLCSRCNSGIGFFRDHPEILQKAIDYLLATT